MIQHKNRALNEGQKKIEKYVFSLKNMLGKGSFASVYLGYCISDNVETAVKVIDKKIFTNNYNYKAIYSEIDIMKKVKHTNIVELLDVYQTTNNMYIVTQLCQEGDLRNYLKKKKKLTEVQAIRFLKDILNGFKYLSEQGITHRDLKPANILLKNGTCKISDFGFAKNLQYGQNTIMRSIVGTPLYMSPQILNHQKYTNKSDLWSVGLIYYQMIHGYTPWPANNQIQLMNNINSKNVSFDSHISQKSKDFIKKCLKIKEEERMSWQQAFSHPLVSQEKDNLDRILMRLKIDQNIRVNEKINTTEKQGTSRFKSRSKSTRRYSNLNRTPKAKPSFTNLQLTPQRKSPWRLV